MGQAGNNFAGHAVEVKGHATVHHVDGTTETITKGMAIYQGDEIETDAQGAVNITFNDNTVFAVSSNAKMTIDEYVYDPDKDGEGAANISVERGIFLYTSGFVGKEDHDDVHIKTPAGSIGIRGTTLTGFIPEDGDMDKATISLIEGAIVVQPKTGGEIYLDESRETIDFKAGGAGENIGVVDGAAFMDTYNVVRSVAPALFNPVVDDMKAHPNGAAPADGAAVTPDATSQDAAAQSADKTGDMPGDAAAGQSSQTTSVESADAAKMDAESDKMIMADAMETTMKDMAISLDMGMKTQTMELGSDAVKSMMMQVLSSGGGSLFSNDLIDLVKEHKHHKLALEKLDRQDRKDDSDRDVIEDRDTVFEVQNTAPHLTTHESNLDMSPEWAAHEGGVYAINIAQYFGDVDGDELTLDAVGSYISGVQISDNGWLTFTVDSLTANEDLELDIFATDGSEESPHFTINFKAYDVNDKYDDYDNLSASTTPNVGHGDVVALLGGHDVINTNGSNNVTIFGGAGNDTITVRGAGNKAYGEEGIDILIFDTSGTNNSLVSGGAGDDIIHLRENLGSNITAFGGVGDDTFIIKGDAPWASFQSDNIKLDGGDGTDTLRFFDMPGVDLSGLEDGALRGIDRIDLTQRVYNGDDHDADGEVANADFEAIIDFASLFDLTGEDTLFLTKEGSGTSKITYDYSLLYQGFTEGNAPVNEDGQDYNVYYTTNNDTGQTQTLYIDADITLVAAA